MDKVMWFELPADDTARAGEFYEKAFGWKTSDMGGGSVMVVNTPSDENGQPHDAGAINGDISPRTDTFNQPTLVLAVEDLDAKLKMVEAAGGRVVKPSEKLDGMNAVYAMVADTEGNVVGLMQDL